MLIDDVIITVMAGKGGDGAVAFRQSEGNPRGGPDGGNGGNGGDVYLVGTTDISALQRFQYTKIEKAEDGISGKRKNLFGRNGEDLFIQVPLGTTVTNTKTHKAFEITDTTTKHQVARGGKGGKGNNEFKSATHQAPRYAEKGTDGEEIELHFEMRLIADIGLIGLPNAGKSSLLSAITNAHPKIGNYPFTTLEPNLGVFMLNDRHIVLADIPGLIEGASKGKGLGIKFLKHIEKTKLLVHCIDATTEDVLASYTTVRKEFAEYSTTLLEKKEFIALTKIDLVSSEDIQKKKKALMGISKNILTVSIYDEESISAFEKQIEALVAEE